MHKIKVLWDVLTRLQVVVCLACMLSSSEIPSGEHLFCQVSTGQFTSSDPLSTPSKKLVNNNESMTTQLLHTP